MGDNRAETKKENYFHSYFICFCNYIVNCKCEKKKPGSKADNL